MNIQLNRTSNWTSDSKSCSHIQNPDVEKAGEDLDDAADHGEDVDGDVEVVPVEGEAVVDHGHHEPGEENYEATAPHVGSANQSHLR